MYKIKFAAAKVLLICQTAKHLQLFSSQNLSENWKSHKNKGNIL